MQHNFRDDNGISFVDQLRVNARIAANRELEDRMNPFIKKIDDMMVEASHRGEHGIALYELEQWDKGIPINAIREHYERLGFAILAQNGNGKQFFISWASK